MAKKRKVRRSIQDELFPGFSERSARNRRNREKGAEWEREVANHLKPLFSRARRLFGQARDGDEVPDVGGTPFWVECAKSGNAQIHSKLKQGLYASDRSPSEYVGFPVVVISKHKSTGLTMATMTLDEWLQLIKRLR